MDVNFIKNMLMFAGFWPKKDGYWYSDKRGYRGIKACIDQGGYIRYEIDENIDFAELDGDYDQDWGIMVYGTYYVDPDDAFKKGHMPTLYEISHNL